MSCDSKVENLGKERPSRAPDQHDVVWLEVTVDDVQRVGSSNSISQLDPDVPGQIDVDRMRTVDHVA